MKKLIALLLLTVLCVNNSASALSRGDKFMSQAQKHLDNKEYTQARYHFLKAFSLFAADSIYEKAVHAGVKVASLYHRENYYKEAFELLGNVDRMLLESKTSNSQNAALMYYPAKERLTMYIKLRNNAKATEWLNTMKSIAKASGNNDLENDLLYNEANLNYSFGKVEAGDAAINKLISLYEKEKDYNKADECFKQLISQATRSKNAELVSRSYARYNQWNDSIRKIREDDELSIITGKLEEANSTIAEKDSTITVKNGVIVTLIVIICALAAILVLGAILLLRQIAASRKAKKNLAIANEHNQLKAQFIHNISEQMAPTLNTLDQSLPAVKALNEFSSHIQTLSDLENSLDERYDAEEVNLTKFSDSVIQQVKPNVKPGVTLTANVPKMSAKFNQQAVEKILLHLLDNAAMYTSDGGKITLEFKKRGAKTMQFIVTDTGCGIPEEKQATIFKPFSEIKDLTTGDGLGLPICSLIAEKLNGSLSIDGEFKHGTRFILEIKS
ncbi:MAG: sensor histidine kinase [Bacteroides sp.]|nr:sensor histidine kinase [Bacteroides sp.]MCM1389710.1 sensor histidine kinase [Bacteroides sp.]